MTNSKRQPHRKPSKRPLIVRKNKNGSIVSPGSPHKQITFKRSQLAAPLRQPAAKLNLKGKSFRVRKPGKPEKTKQTATAKPLQPYGRDPRELIDQRFEIVQRLKEGGTGSVYQAQDTLLKLPVAIKVLSDRFVADEQSMATLFDEARIAMQLSHKHIVRLHNIQQSQGLFYLVMEYIDGYTLRELLADEDGLSVETVVQIADVLEDALGHAHRRGIYHRDLKPDNIMISHDGIVKLIDFGLACLTDYRRDHDGEIQGTPFYMSPEAVAGLASDHRADIYSMAVTLHELLTGKLPVPPDHDPANFFDTRKVVADSLPEPIRRVLKTALAESPEDRWQNVTEFVTAFRQACYHP